MVEVKRGARSLAVELRAQLRAYPRDRVSAFVTDVEKSIKSHQFGETLVWAHLPDDHRELLRLKRETERFLDALSTPADPRPFSQNLDDLMDTVANDREIGEDWFRDKQSALAGARAVLKHIETALAEPNAGGRGRPHADQRGLLARIARKYHEHIGVRPSSTPGKPFANIVALVLKETTGKPVADVGRQVRAALKSM